MAPVNTNTKRVPLLPFREVSRNDKGIITGRHPFYHKFKAILEGRPLCEQVIIASNDAGYFTIARIDAGILLFNYARPHPLIPSANRPPKLIILSTPINILGSCTGTASANPQFEDLHAEVMSYPEIFTESTVQLSRSGCWCPSAIVTITMPAISPSMCFPKQFFEEPGLQVTLDPPIARYFSLSKTLYNPDPQPNGGARHYRAILPQPYPINVQWPLIEHVPALHLERITRKEAYLYGLCDEMYRTTLTNAYKSEPRTWSQAEHPLLGEPAHGHELYIHSSKLYGSETLFRTEMASHPLAFSHIISTSNTSEDLHNERFEVLHPNSMEDFLLSNRTEFFEKKGTVTCPICFPIFHGPTKITVKRYNRGEYIEHFRKTHSKDAPFIGVGFITGLNSRILEGLSLYLMALSLAYFEEDSELPKSIEPHEPEVYERTAIFVHAHETEIRNQIRSSRVVNTNPKKPTSRAGFEVLMNTNEEDDMTGGEEESQMQSESSLLQDPLETDMQRLHGGEYDPSDPPQSTSGLPQRRSKQKRKEKPDA
jgi:hypothetical protein